MEATISAQVIKDAFAGKPTSAVTTASQEPNPKRKAAEFLGLSRDETGERLPKKIKPLDKIWSAREKKGGESKRLKNTIDLLSPPFVPRSPVKALPSSTRPGGGEKHNSNTVNSVIRIPSTPPGTQYSHIVEKCSQNSTKTTCTIKAIDTISKALQNQQLLIEPPPSAPEWLLSPRRPTENIPASTSASSISKAIPFVPNSTVEKSCCGEDDCYCTKDDLPSPALEVRVAPPRQPLEFSTEQLLWKDRQTLKQTQRTTIDASSSPVTVQRHRKDRSPSEPNPWESEESGPIEETRASITPQLEMDARLEKNPWIDNDNNYAAPLSPVIVTEDLTRLQLSPTKAVTSPKISESAAQEPSGTCTAPIPPRAQTSPPPPLITDLSHSMPPTLTPFKLHNTKIYISLYGRKGTISQRLSRCMPLTLRTFISAVFSAWDLENREDEVESIIVRFSWKPELELLLWRGGKRGLGGRGFEDGFEEMLEAIGGSPRWLRDEAAESGTELGMCIVDVVVYLKGE